MSTAGEAILGSTRRLVILTLLGCALIAASAPAASARGAVPTDNGPVRGVDTPTVSKYLGIPYATPPVGELRWQPPQPAQRWNGPRDASQFGGHCPQAASPFGQESSTEDCLYLNVFTPNGKVAQEKKGKVKLKKAKRLPVMVWLHGGALVVGESDDYDPTRLVEKGVVVVTLNYRLGFLGFLAHPALSAESPDQSSGNYGLMDQQAALGWVQRNIKKFGGDRDNVTIFGESAGGLSVHAQLASPDSAGLFDRAIAQSGAYSPREPSLADAETRGLALAHNMGCEVQTKECLRSVSVETLLANQPELPGEIGPNVDGNALPQSIRAAFESGQFNRVPVIEGSNHDEFSLFAALNVEFVFGPLPPVFYPIAVNILLPTLGLNASPAEVLAQYPLANYTSVGLALTAIGTDALFACPARRAAGSLSQFVPTFTYEFNDPNAPQRFIPPASFPYGAYHAAEVQYLFDLPNPLNAPALNGDQQSLADTMVRYWTQFAGAGTPNAIGTPQWPGYTVATDRHQSLEPPTPVTGTGFAADHKCGFWDAQ
ncbi:MAG: carboxylesterase/lipase family protein [Solirubrobacterales bacterium]